MEETKRLVVTKEHTCTFFVYLTFSKTVCTIGGVPRSTKVRHFRELLVLACGVPFAMQRLHYLDSCDLKEDDTLRSLHIVNNASFRMGVWKEYEKLFQCVHENDYQGLLRCCMLCEATSERDETTNNNLPTTKIAKDTPKDDIDLLEHTTGAAVEYLKRAELALFVAAFLGRLEIAKNLMDAGVCVQRTTDLGYSALHASTAGGWFDCIDYLLKEGADVHLKSKQMKRALQIAKVNGFDSARHLRTHEWQVRAAKMTKKEQKLQDTLLMQHQMFDLHSRVWIDGAYSTKCMCTSTYPVDEYSGSRIDAPKRLPPKTPQNRKKYQLVADKHVPDHLDISFSKWVNNKNLEYGAARKASLEMEAGLSKVKEAEENEKNNCSRAKDFYHEQKKRKAHENDENTERTNTDMYEDRTSMPKYQMSIIRQYTKSFLLTNE